MGLEESVLCAGAAARRRGLALQGRGYRAIQNGWPDLSSEGNAAKLWCQQVLIQNRIAAVRRRVHITFGAFPPAERSK